MSDGLSPPKRAGRRRPWRSGTLEGGSAAQPIVLDDDIVEKPAPLPPPFSYPRERFLVDGDMLLILSDEEGAGDSPQASVDRGIFASKYLSRQAWLSPSRKDVSTETLAKVDVSLEDVLAALRNIPSKHWVNKGRLNVRPSGLSAIDSITLGLVTARSARGRPMPSNTTRLYPHLCQLLLRFWKQHLSVLGDSLPGMKDASGGCAGGSSSGPGPTESGTTWVCTSIQLNRNYAAREHVDGNNLGPSWLIAAGDWKDGGELWVEDPAGDEEHAISVDVRRGGSLQYRCGDRCRGRFLDVRGRWACFDGRKMHFAWLRLPGELGAAASVSSDRGGAL